MITLLIRACLSRKLSVAMFLCITAFISTNAFALPTHNLYNDSWSVISIPADPGGNTIEMLFGDDLPIEQYGRDSGWVVQAHDATTNQFRDLTLNDTLAANTGYRIKQEVADLIQLDLPDSLSAPAGQAIPGCNSDLLCTFQTLVGRAGGSQWNLVGASIDPPIRYGDTRFQADNTACATGCTPRAFVLN